MTADITDLIWCVALWVVPLATIGATELIRHKRQWLGMLNLGVEARSDPSTEMWSSAMRSPLPARSAR